MVKKKISLFSGLLARKEEDKRENSFFSLGSASSGFEWSCLASKKMTNEKDRGDFAERIRRRR